MTHKVQLRHTSGDLRVPRTHKLIVEALIELTIQKGFSNVTVSDIAQYAGINRATFYRHYQDKFDLLAQYTQAVYELTNVSETESLANESLSENLPLGLIRMFEHIRDNARFYRVMLSPNGDPAFVEKVRQYIEQRLRRLLPETLLQKGNLADIYLSYMSSGLHYGGLSMTCRTHQKK